MPDNEQSSSQGNVPDREIMSQWLALQAQDLEQRRAELDIRAQELALNERENERSHAYATQALGVKAAENAQHVSVFQRMVHWRYALIGLGIICTSILCYVAIDRGHAEIVEKIATYAIAGLGGGGIGYAIRSKKADKEKRDSDDDS